ncbi:MAG: thioredoxin-dependent thiol peroxidase [Legionellales bacterium]|nr:thioredoxin-dependent thiol peroxidase [Legionellales bacterium]|tara:strand:+ start:2784 stop:3248 length:465 start_codon:yes stop_codon:yes gene_type:complete
MLGQHAPSVNLPNQDGEPFSLQQCSKQFVLVYFYPKDMTPGCTTQACELSEAWSSLMSLNCDVIGISKDSPKRHRQFIDKYQLPFTLLSDPDGAVCDAYGVWIQKSMFGKRYMGIERSSFLLDADRLVCQIWRKVKPAEHAQQVLSYLEAAQRS